VRNNAGTGRVEGSTTRASAHRLAGMIRLLVLYGQPKDPVSFDKYYHETHIPIAKRMKGLKKWTIGKVQGTPDGQPAPFYYVAAGRISNNCWPRSKGKQRSRMFPTTPQAGRRFSTPRSKMWSDLAASKRLQAKPAAKGKC
jgi:hypothetical protein